MNMHDFVKNAKIKEEELKELIRVLQRKTGRAPKGRLIVSQSHGKAQYYKKNGTRIYIKSSEIDLARALAQKEYDEKLLTAAMCELKQLQQAAGINPDLLTEIYYNLPENRRCLVRPFRLSDEEYAERWQNIIYERKSFNEDDKTEYYTKRGERVRSKSEVMIGDRLDGMRRKYHYEKPLRLADGGIIHPDFTVLREKERDEIYIEHFGKMGDGEYSERNMDRINRYIDSGIYPGERLFITHETDIRPLSTRRLDALLHAWLD